MRRVILMLVVLFLASCASPTPEIVRETVVVTRVMPTHTAYPTYTPYPTYTVQPTPKATATPVLPTATPAVPTPTPTPAFEPVTKTLGPIYNSLHDERFTMEITLLGVKWSEGEKYETPKSGNMFVVAYLRIKNLGPGVNRNVGSLDYKVRDANGALRDTDYVVHLARDCNLDFVDLPSGASVEGCVSFQVPAEGSVELIYAPYRYEGLKEGRYLGFELR